MIQQMHKIIHEKDERHGMLYRYSLNKVFNYSRVVSAKGTLVIAKKMFTLTTLVENECV